MRHPAPSKRAPRVAALSTLTPEQRRLVIALVAMAKAEKPAERAA